MACSCNWFSIPDDFAVKHCTDMLQQQRSKSSYFLSPNRKVHLVFVATVRKFGMTSHPLSMSHPQTWEIRMQVSHVTIMIHCRT